jgi:hypothetical protein
MMRDIAHLWCAAEEDSPIVKSSTIDTGDIDRRPDLFLRGLRICQ